MKSIALVLFSLMSLTVLCQSKKEQIKFLEKQVNLQTTQLEECHQQNQKIQTKVETQKDSMHLLQVNYLRTLQRYNQLKKEYGEMEEEMKDSKEQIDSLTKLTQKNRKKSDVHQMEGDYFAMGSGSDGFGFGNGTGGEGNVSAIKTNVQCWQVGKEKRKLDRQFSKTLLLNAKKTYRIKFELVVAPDGEVLDAIPDYFHGQKELTGAELTWMKDLIHKHLHYSEEGAIEKLYPQFIVLTIFKHP